MNLSMGAFKECYRSQSIFWNGSYNLDGSGDYRTIGEARRAVDLMWSMREQTEREEIARKLANGAIPVSRNGESVHMTLPDGTSQTMTIRQFRQSVFQIEEQWDRETVFV